MNRRALTAAFMTTCMLVETCITNFTPAVSVTMWMLMMSMTRHDDGGDEDDPDGTDGPEYEYVVVINPGHDDDGGLFVLGRKIITDETICGTA